MHWRICSNNDWKYYVHWFLSRSAGYYLPCIQWMYKIFKPKKKKNWRREKKGFKAINSSNRWKEQQNVLKNTEFREENKRQMKNHEPRNWWARDECNFSYFYILYPLLSFYNILYISSKEIFILIWIFDARQSKLNLIEFNDFPVFLFRQWQTETDRVRSEKSGLLFIWILNKRGTWVWLVVIRKNLFMLCSVFSRCTVHF